MTPTPRTDKTGLLPNYVKRTMILFLDFDGVLHPFAHRHTGPHFTALSRLESILREFPSVHIVIASTWRENHSLAELANLFSKDIQHQVIGVLPSLPCESASEIVGHRQREAMVWLSHHFSMQEMWIALDDDPNEWSATNVILCADGFGISEEIRLRNAFKEKL